MKRVAIIAGTQSLIQAITTTLSDISGTVEVTHPECQEFHLRRCYDDNYALASNVLIDNKPYWRKFEKRRKY